jgi:hypothetical protein
MIYGTWQATYVVAQVKAVSQLVTGSGSHNHLRG